MKRIFVALLAVILTAAFLVSCSGAPASTSVTESPAITANPTSTPDEITEEERKAKEEEERIAKEEEERLAKEARKSELMEGLQTAYDASNWIAVKTIADSVNADFPGGDEALKATEYLTEATAKIEEAGTKALKTFKKEYDKVQKITWLYSKSAPKYADDRTCFYTYLGQYDSGEVWMRVVANYTGDDWIFFKKIIFSIDGVNQTETLDYFSDILRDNAYGNVWEIADYEIGSIGVGLSDSERKFITDIINSEETIIRFESDEYYYDHIVTKKEKEGLSDILAAYDYFLFG